MSLSHTPTYKIIFWCSGLLHTTTTMAAALNRPSRGCYWLREETALVLWWRTGPWIGAGGARSGPVLRDVDRLLHLCWSKHEPGHTAGVLVLLMSLGVDSLSADRNWTQQQEVMAQLDTNRTEYQEVVAQLGGVLHFPVCSSASWSVDPGPLLPKKSRFWTSVTSKLRRARVIDLMEILIGFM
jgi:hypothetical protein